MPRPSANSLRYPGVTIERRLSPPQDLNDNEREVFLNIISTTAADHFRPSDAVLLSALCRAVVREREASERLADGVVSIDNKLSAWATVQAQSLKQVMALSRMLKLSPLARRSNPSRPGKQSELSYYEVMRLEKSSNGEIDS